MAEEQDKELTSGGIRFRLPKLFAETVSEPAAEETAAASAEPGAGVEFQAPAAPAPKAGSPATPKAKEPKKTLFGAVIHSNEPTTDTAPDNAALSNAMGQATLMMAQMQEMQEELRRMHEVVVEINDRENAHEKVFNTLHTELREYKTDFIYEHFKPVVRPLLFLYDSLEQFDAEIALYERPNQGERRQVGLSPQLVRDNIAFFRDQLAESLRICEVTPMDTPNGPFNAKLHKVIDVVPADESQDGIIQRVVRSGWYLNGQLLRPAEVIVGKKM